jgi:hypothetical protein
MFRWLLGDEILKKCEWREKGGLKLMVVGL